MKKNKLKGFLLLVSLCSALFFVGCNSEDDETKKENVPFSVTAADPLAFAVEGESKLIALRGSDPWVATSNASWLKLSQTSGNESCEIIATAETHDGDDVRNAEVEIKCGNNVKTVNVVQYGVKPVLIVDTNRRGMNCFAGELVVNVTSNTDYNIEVESEGDWLVEKKTKAIGETRHTFVYGATTPERSAKIKVSYNGGEVIKEIPVIQYKSRDKEVNVILNPVRPTYIDIVVLGDGFTPDDNVIGGAYEKEATKIIDYMFSIPPMNGYKDYFRVSLVYANSVDRGADDAPDTGEAPVNLKNTVFDAHYGAGGIERLLIFSNLKRNVIYEYVACATSQPTERTIILGVVNDKRYGGSGGLFAVTSLNSSSSEVMLHEIGHIFGLADEYVDEEYAALNNITIEKAKNKPNVDITGDLEQIKWKHFIGLNGYTESAFEGGFYLEKGVWRPWDMSIMCSPLQLFNAASREQIAKDIYKRVGESYSLNEFLKKDVPPILPKPANVRSVFRNFVMPVPLEVYVHPKDLPNRTNN